MCFHAYCSNGWLFSFQTSITFRDERFPLPPFHTIWIPFLARRRGSTFCTSTVRYRCLAVLIRRAIHCKNSSHGFSGFPLFRRSVAVVDAANPFSNFFLPSTQAKKVAASLMAGEFLLLTGHRQSGKTTLAQSIVADLNRVGCLTTVIWLTNLRSMGSRGIFNMILGNLKISHNNDDCPRR